MSRQDRKVRWVKENLVPLLDREEWKEHWDTDEKRIEEAQLRLAETYVDEGSGVVRAGATLIVILAVLDAGFVIPGQAYGIAFDIWGTWFLLAEGGLQGRYSIASQAARIPGIGLGKGQKKNTELERALARETVVTNIGLCWLTLGFLLQLTALVWFPDGNLITTDLLR